MYLLQKERNASQRDFSRHSKLACNKESIKINYFKIVDNISDLYDYCDMRANK